MGRLTEDGDLYEVAKGVLLYAVNNITRGDVYDEIDAYMGCIPSEDDIEKVFDLIGEMLRGCNFDV